MRVKGLNKYTTFTTLSEYKFEDLNARGEELLHDVLVVLLGLHGQKVLVESAHADLVPILVRMANSDLILSEPEKEVTLGSKRVASEVKGGVLLGDVGRHGVLCAEGVYPLEWEMLLVSNIG